jgi:hypothetical protein
MIPGERKVINGALIHSVDSNVTLDNTTVERVTSDSGGALYLTQILSTSNILTLSAAKFYNCSALTEDGGAVYVAQTVSKIRSSIFDDNSAFRSGGAVYYSMEATDASIEYSSIRFNKSCKYHDRHEPGLLRTIKSSDTRSPRTLQHEHNISTDDRQRVGDWI